MARPLRVAVVGAGPAGLYVADALLFQHTRADDSETGVPVQVDVFDRLPTPFGLLRYGVAPDHLKMKSLARALQRTLDDDRVRFFGHVEVGTDVSVAQLRADHDAVVHTFGASTDRRLGIPGEDLPGSVSATEFVNWYSGHPDVVSAPPLTATDLTTGQADKPRALTLADYLSETMRLLEANPDAPEIVIERVKFQRHAEREGRYDEAFAAINP